VSDGPVVPIRGEMVVAHERRHVVEAGAVGLVVGWLLGRRHHPLVWAAVLGAVFAAGALSWWSDSESVTCGAESVYVLKERPSQGL